MSARDDEQEVLQALQTTVIHEEQDGVSGGGGGGGGAGAAAESQGGGALAAGVGGATANAAIRSYPYRPSGGRMNESKGPEIFACVSPTLGDWQLPEPSQGKHGKRGKHERVKRVDMEGPTPGGGDNILNTSSRMLVTLDKHWTREAACQTKLGPRCAGRFPQLLARALLWLCGLRTYL
jgi:hypothetical protein